MSESRAGAVILNVVLLQSIIPGEFAAANVTRVDLPQMDAVEVSPEMDQLAELLAAFATSEIPDFVVNPENVFPQHFVFVVALIAQVTSVFPFVVMDRVDVDLNLFLTDETFVADLAGVPDAKMLRFDMLLPPAHTGEGFLALIALQFFRAIDWKWAIHWEWEFRLNGRVR